MPMAAGLATLMVGVVNATFAEVTFEWATVGNPGNPADPTNSGSIPDFASVAYEYRIARHEVTNGQYAEFLNAVAATDTNDLYHVSMGNNTRGGAFDSVVNSLRSSFQACALPTGQDGQTGFPVASPVTICFAHLDGDGDVDVQGFGDSQAQYTSPK